MNNSYPPRAFAPERAGRWVAEPGWPSPNVTPRTMFLNSAGLGETPEREAPLTLCSPQDTGLGALEWCSYGGRGADQAVDQREDDAKSLRFDGAVLGERLEILGQPVAQLEVAADRPVAKLALRLCDVAPDGASTRVTYTLFNLTHRDSRESPEPSRPGRRYRVAIPLNHVAHAFLPGHRLRLALSTCYWPQMWPVPVPLTLFAGASRLVLPVRGSRPVDAELRPFPPPEGSAPLADTDLRLDRTRYRIRRDLGAGETRVAIERDWGAQYMQAIDLTVDGSAVETYRIRDGDPLSATGETVNRQSRGRDDWRVSTRTRTALSLTASDFVASAELDAFEGERRVFSCDRRFSVPRDLN